MPLPDPPCTVRNRTCQVLFRTYARARRAVKNNQCGAHRGHLPPAARDRLLRRKAINTMVVPLGHDANGSWSGQSIPPMPTSYEMRMAALARAEQTLRRHLAREHGSPFIGHHDISEPMRSDVEHALVVEIGGVTDDFLDYVTVQYPLLAVWAVATTLAEQYGPDTDHASYGPISHRLGMEISTNRRDSFNDRFRRACNEHGLILPPKYPGTQDLIGDYLFQAGVPHSQIRPLVDAFLRVEQKSGLPDCEDTAEVKSWEEQAMEHVPTHLTRLRKILGEDSTGYHATVYVRLREGDQPTTDFERRVKELCGDTGLTPRPPSLTFRDGDLRIEAAPRGQPLEVTIDRSQPPRRLNPQEGTVLSPPWPRCVRWQASTERNNWQSLSLFKDPQADILLFDGDSGRLKGVLNHQARSVPRIPAGSISLVSMRLFRVNGEDAYQLGQNAYVLYPESSKALCISQGDACLNAQVDPRLHLEVDGCRVARHADGLLLAEPRTVVLRGDVSGLIDNLEIKLEFGMHFISRIPVHIRPSGDLVAPLNLPTRGPFGKVRISLHVKSQNRALNRYVFWYWPSLRGLRDQAVFDAESIPENLAKTHLKHLPRTADGRLSLQKDAPYLRAILAFSVDRRVVSFTFPPPGISIFVRTSNGKECPLLLGTELDVPQDKFASHLIVRCPEQPADIDFKGHIIPNPFDKLGLWRRPFASLAEPGRHNVIRLRLPSHPQDAIDLVRIRSRRREGRSLLAPPALRGGNILSSGNIEEDRWLAKLVDWRRTTETASGSPRYVIFTLVVVGDRRGRVGYGFGRSDDTNDAVRKSIERARRRMIPVPRRGNTISHAMKGSYSDTTVLLEPASPGTGIVASDPVRAVMEAAGVSDVLSSYGGSRITTSIVIAVFSALGSAERTAYSGGPSG